MRNIFTIFFILLNFFVTAQTEPIRADTYHFIIEKKLVDQADIENQFNDSSLLKKPFFEDDQYIVTLPVTVNLEELLSLPVNWLVTHLHAAQHVLL